MSLKIIHFIVFIITSLMFGVFAVICWSNYNNWENAEHMFWLAIGFALGSAGLFGYSFWYLKEARKVIT